MRIASALLALSLVAGCGDDFHAVQKADTIEAYEGWLAKNPSSRFDLQARTRLEELYLAKADAEPSLEAYDLYLDKFPEGAYRDKAMKAREDFLWNWALEENTPDAWKKFLEEYPRAAKKRKVKADRALAVAAYVDHLELAPVRQERINLAEDPEGPLDGWGFFVDVTNRGEKTVETLELTIAYLGDEGRTLQRDEWPVAAPFFPVPIEEEFKKPLKPGESRTWVWTTGDLPDGWTQQVKVYPSRVEFAGPK